MWIATKLGFYSIKRSSDKMWDVSARLKQDLLNLCRHFNLIAQFFHDTGNPNSPWKITIGKADLQNLFVKLIPAAGEPDLLDCVAASDNQRAKLPAYRSLAMALRGLSETIGMGTTQAELHPSFATNPHLTTLSPATPRYNNRKEFREAFSYTSAEAKRLWPDYLRATQQVGETANTLPPDHPQDNSSGGSATVFGQRITLHANPTTQALPTVLKPKTSSKMPHESFAWPSVDGEPGRNRGGVSLDQSPEKGVLRLNGYSVGKGKEDESWRRGRLAIVFESSEIEFPEPKYKVEWHTPKSGRRLEKMANCLAAFCRLQRQREDVRWALAIEQWEADLAWLKRTYYDGQFD